jgi:hypothetical protein
MSANTILVIVGAVLVVVGLAKAGQSGGFGLSNFGINFGGTSTQSNKVGNVTPEATKSGKTDWSGLGIAAIGLVTAIIGLFKG